MSLKVTRKEVEDILKKAQQLVAADVFILSLRDCNEAFTNEYNLTNAKIREIFLAIKVEDFHTADYNNSENYNPDDVCYVFVPQVMLTDVTGEKKRHNVYVKFVIVERRINDVVILISFHEAEHSVNYPFR